MSYFYQLPHLYFFPLIVHRVKSRLSMDSTSTPLPGSPAHSHQSPASTPTLSNLADWSSCNLLHTSSSIHSNGSCHTLTPRSSPVHTEHHTDIKNQNSTHSRHSSSAKSLQRRGHNCTRTEEAFPRPNFEPKNLLSLFEETTPWEQSCQFTSPPPLKCQVKGTKCIIIPGSLLSSYTLLLPFCESPI